MSGGQNVLHRADSIGARNIWRWQAASFCVKPHGRRPRDDSDTVIRPHGIPVLHALGVMPHAVTVDEVCAGLLCNLDTTAVNMLWHTADHVLRHLAQALGRPALTHGFQVAANTARRNAHGRPADLKVLPCFLA